MHLASQGVKLAPQLLYCSLTFFKATGEIAHTHRPVSCTNCSNRPRKFRGEPLLPSLMTGVTV